MLPHSASRRSPVTPAEDGIAAEAPSPHAAWSRPGDTTMPAALFLHGYTGSPSSMRPLAESVADTGATLSVPRLPGHGGTWRQLRATGWEDWSAAALAEFDRLAAEHPGVIVVGLSMGGSLSLLLGALRRPQAVIAVNPALYVDSPLAPATPLLWPFVPTVASIGGDIAKPGVQEDANERTPVRAVASLHRGLARLRQQLWLIEAPVTVCVSGRDGVVAPRSLRALRAGLSTPPRIVALRHSRHVATLDYDADVIAQQVRAALRPEVRSAG